MLHRTTGPNRRRGVRHKPQDPRATVWWDVHDHGILTSVGRGVCGGHGGRISERPGQVPVGLRQQRVRRSARGRPHFRPVPAASVHTHQAAAPTIPVWCRHQPGHTHNGRRREAAQRVGCGHGRRRSRPPVGPTFGAQATQGHTVHMDQREYLYAHNLMFL